MRQGHQNILALLSGMLLIAALPAHAAATAEEAAKLGKELTPIGAERAGSKDGAIPAWSGEADQPAAGWSWGKQRSEFWKHKDEKPLYSVDASNLDKYADKVTPGLQAIIKQRKAFRMDVYPTHRDCVVSKSVEERTRLNASEAKLAADGWGMASAHAGGVPFPIPKNGVEAMWNMKLRPSGLGFIFKKGGSVVAPRPGTNDYVFYDWQLTQYWPQGAKDAKKIEDYSGVEFYTYYKYSAPAALAGQAIVSISYLDTKYPDNYYYFPGQRRVRRLPTYVFDAPLIGFENEYPVEMQNMLWTTLDKFDYKLVGKKEIFIPHDAFGMYNFKTRHEDAYKATVVNPDNGRWELHRVWVVESTVKNGERHSLPHQTFYIDEDTWNVLLVDAYDSKGNIWQSRMAWQIPVWELGGMCTYNPFVMYDLASGRYTADFSVLGQGVDVQYFQESNDPTFKSGFYTPDNLREISER